MPVWRQIVLLILFVSSAACALFVALGPARHRAAIRQGSTLSVFVLVVVFVVVDAILYIGAEGTPPLLQITAAAAALSMLIAVPLAWRRAGREGA